ncbi:hypothetical protein FPV67DRAFT_221251 [Lyophyllum atratum]|nr:hypothetical protein FPV67DRAFT_221251 [Lyophyllum atratum]
MAIKDTSRSPPWENWELDANFLGALDRWTHANPESSLDRVLRRVCLLIDEGREFFEVIPDGAFPARGLVKALAHLVKLGHVRKYVDSSMIRLVIIALLQTISTAKSDVRRFAEDVIRWVSQVSATFASGQASWIGAHFTETTWTNLADMRYVHTSC